MIPTGATNETYDNIVDFLNHSKARGVVVFASETDVRWLLAAVHRKNLANHFIWIGSDDWGTKLSPVESYKVEAEGSLTIIPAKIPAEGKEQKFYIVTEKFVPKLT